MENDKQPSAEAMKRIIKAIQESIGNAEVEVPKLVMRVNLVEIKKEVEVYKDAAVRRAVEGERERCISAVEKLQSDTPAGFYWSTVDLRNALNGKEAADDTE